MSIAATREPHKEHLLFPWWQVLVYGTAFLVVFRLAQVGLRSVCSNWIPFDCPYYWPISIFQQRVPTVPQVIWAIALLVIFAGALWILERKRYDIRLVCATGILLIAGSTLIQGVPNGFYAPVAGDAQSGVLIADSPDGQEYYHEALKVTDPLDFLRRYNEIQPTLSRHSHTHPPGAVLTFYVLEKLLRDPALITIFIMLAATLSTTLFFYRLVRTEFERDESGYMSFLLVLLPAIQIYFLATIDALIAGLVTGALYFFCFGSGRRSTVAATAMVISSFLLTFVTLFILPVLVCFEIFVKGTVKRSLVLIGGVVGFHVLLYLLLGYDAWHSFRTASLYENPNGPMPLVEPVNYLFTRLEDIAEIVFFFGPFLVILFLRGMRGLGGVKKILSRPLIVLTILGCASVLGMYVVGAWRTGETARACAFIYPYLLFPVAGYLNGRNDSRIARMQLAALVFVQAVTMQAMGNYFW